MIRFKQTLVGAAVGLGLCLSAGPVHAMGYPAFDVMRTAELAIQATQRLLGLISEYQKVDAKRQEQRVWEDKKAIKPEEQPYDSLFAFVKGWGPFDKESNIFLSPKRDGKVLTARELEKQIRETYFLSADIGKGNVTEAMRKEIRMRRHEYAEALAKEILSMSAGIQSSAGGDLMLLRQATLQTGNKPIQAASDIQQLDLLVQTQKTALEQKGADLVFQTKRLELDALEMLLGLDEQLITNTEAEEK